MSVDVKAFFSNPKSYLIGVLLMFAGDKIWGYIAKGAEVDFNTAVKEQLIVALEDRGVVKKMLENKDFVELFFESEIVQENIADLGTNLRDEIIDDVIKKDSNKISSRSYVAKELGIRDEAYLPLLVKALNAVENEENASKNDVKRIVKKQVKPAALKPVVF